MKSEIEKISNKIVNAFVNNKIIAPIPSKFTKKLVNAQKFRKLCPSYARRILVLNHEKLLSCKSQNIALFQMPSFY